MMKPDIATWVQDKANPKVERFLNRPAFSADAESTAASALADIRRRGDVAVADYVRKFDGVQMKPDTFLVPADAFLAARGSVTQEFRKAAQDAHRRILRFALAGRPRDWTMPTPRGGRLGEVFHALDRVGVYVPAGAAPLASTALMTVTLAKAAGVREIVACTPCRPDGHIDPNVLFALELAGATEVYRVGGIQAIGLMAYGTDTVRRVQKIVGPGGAYVTAAKRQVYGQVALDLVAGPSEIAVLADASARPDCVAADLLSQAEHGTGDERALLVTPSEALAESVQREVDEQMRTLSRGAAIRKVMTAGGMLLVVVPDLEQGAELCNRFAPEHLELLVRDPKALLKRIHAAGAVFLGPWTPESAGDFVAGPSHVLPTGGAAAMFSGLTVGDFMRRSSVVAFSRADLRETLPTIEAFGRVEGLDGHARSASLRFKAPGRAGRGKAQPS
jgi:histidinol dehydrogenase